MESACIDIHLPEKSGNRLPIETSQWHVYDWTTTLWVKHRAHSQRLTSWCQYLSLSLSTYKGKCLRISFTWLVSLCLSYVTNSYLNIGILPILISYDQECLKILKESHKNPLNWSKILKISLKSTSNVLKSSKNPKRILKAGQKSY